MNYQAHPTMVSARQVEPSQKLIVAGADPFADRAEESAA